MESIGGIGNGITSTIKENPLGTTIAVGAGVLGAGLVTAAVIKSRKKKSVRKSSRKKNNSNRSRKRRTGRKTPRTAGKGKDRSTRRIRYTKKGQPYVIKSNGRAMFIKKSSAKKSHKLKGGRY